MIKNIFICDRCGKTIERTDKAIKYYSANVVKHTGDFARQSKTGYLLDAPNHLCKECAKDIQRYINNATK